jgi:hypothetical protein
MVGKHIDVGRPVTYQSESFVASDKAVVMARVIGARASDTTTDLAIVSAGDFDSFIQGARRFEWHDRCNGARKGQGRVAGG